MSSRPPVSCTLVVHDPTAEWVRQLHTVLDELPDDVRLVDGASARSNAHPPAAGDVPEADLIVLEASASDGAALELARALRSRSQHPEILLSGPPLNARQLLDVMRSGVAEYLPLPASHDEVRDAMVRLLGRNGHRVGPPPSERTLTAVFGHAGGVGVSTFATNLGLLLDASTAGRTLLLDLSTPGGGSEALLDLTPRFGIHDLTRNLERLDGALLESYVTEHPSGLHLIGAPTDGFVAEEVTAAHFARVLDVVTGVYPHVVVDLGSALAQRLIPALERATHRIQVTQATLGALRNGRRHLAALESRVDGLRRRLYTIVNHIDPDAPIGPDDVARTLEVSIRLELPEDVTMRHRDAAGAGPAITHRNSAYGHVLTQFVEREFASTRGNGTAHAQGSRSNGWLERLLPERRRTARTATSPAPPQS